MILNKLRQLFKGHQISEPHFGDRIKHKHTKLSKGLLNHSSCDKKVKKYKKQAISINSSKAENKNYLSISLLSKPDQVKNHSMVNSIEKSRKKYSSKVKLKQSTPTTNIRLHDYKPEEYIKHLKKMNLDPRTPKMASETSSRVTSKLNSHKKSSANIKDKTQKQFYTVSNSSF
jgi:hypothetical protein